MFLYLNLIIENKFCIIREDIFSKTLIDRLFNYIEDKYIFLIKCILIFIILIPAVKNYSYYIIKFSK